MTIRLLVYFLDLWRKNRRLRKSNLNLAEFSQDRYSTSLEGKEQPCQSIVLVELREPVSSFSSFKVVSAEVRGVL